MEAQHPCPHRYMAAYSYCEAVTGQQARNFAYGIRLLPADKRQAMSALYAFSRRVDDIGDGTLATDAKADRGWRRPGRCSARIRDGAVAEDDTDPVAVALADAARRFPIPLGGLDELIDGVLMDVRGETLRDLGRPEGLLPVCRGRHRPALARRVRHRSPARRAPNAPPSTPTRSGSRSNSPTSSGTFARTPATGGPTCPPTTSPSSAARPGFDGPLPPPGSDFAGLVHFEVRRARALFAEGYRLLPMLDRRSGACVAAMAGIYRRLLDRIERDPEAVLRGRVSLPGREKAYVAVRGLSGLDARHVSAAAPPGGAPDAPRAPRRRTAAPRTVPGDAGTAPPARGRVRATCRRRWRAAAARPTRADGRRA